MDDFVFAGQLRSNVILVLSGRYLGQVFTRLFAARVAIKATACAVKGVDVAHEQEQEQIKE